MDGASKIRQPAPPCTGDTHAHDRDRASTSDHALGLRSCEHEAHQRGLLTSFIK
jgi:hypothetical protein